MNEKQKKRKTGDQYIILGVYLALAFGLSFIDRTISGHVLPMLPGIRIGIANIVVVVVVLEYSFIEGLMFAVLKAILTTVPFGGLMSLAIGGTATIVSFLLMEGIKHSLKKHVSPIGISLGGGITHILTQLLVIGLLYKIMSVLPYYGFFLVLVSFATSIIVGIVDIQIIKFLKKEGDNEMEKLEKKILNKIKEYDKIIIHRHKLPDGDAYGSQLGLKNAILTTFPNKKVYAAGKTSERFSFLGKMDNPENYTYDNALVIVTDTGATHLIEGDDWVKGEYKIKIDHHEPVEEYADLNYVKQDNVSAASVVTGLVRKFKWKITKEGANCLYTGITTDSGRFLYRGVNKETFEEAGFLMEQGADIEYIYRNLYDEDLNLKLLRAKMTLKFVIEDRVAYMINTKEEVKESGFDFFTISRGMVGVMSGIKEIDIWANFTENEEGNFIAELRSKDKTIVHVAEEFGGGGHALACGATLKNKDEIKKMVDRLKEVLK